MQFSLENDIAASTRMDTSLAKPPPYAHKRKALEAANISLNASLGIPPPAKLDSSLGGPSLFEAAGMKRMADTSLGRKTPSKKARSPSRAATPGGSITPGRRTPGREGGDRFIPNRSAIDMETASHLLLQRSLRDTKEDEVMSPSKREYQRVMAENLGTDLSNTRVLAFQAKPPTAPEGHSNNLKILYSATKNPKIGRASCRERV